MLFRFFFFTRGKGGCYGLSLLTVQHLPLTTVHAHSYLSAGALGISAEPVLAGGQ